MPDPDNGELPVGFAGICVAIGVAAESFCPHGCLLTRLPAGVL